MPDVAIVGGGITGLATAWFLRRSAPDVPVTIYEASDRLGGKLRTSELAGVAVEEGPDTFLARVPWAVDLCRELGLAGELVEPATSKAYVWTRGRLRPLPDGTVLGVPYRLGPLARSGILSPAGLGRATLDLVLPGTATAEDGSVAAVVGRRFGRELVDRLVEPLLGGIHAGRADRLSLASVAPQVAEAAARGRSLMVELRRSRSAAAGGPVFLGLRGGMQRLVERLRERLDGVDIRTGCPVESLEELAAAAVVLTVPAFVAAPLVRPLSEVAAHDLEQIGHASVVTATLAYAREALARPLDGSGFLVPRVEGRLMTACTWTSSKWPTASPSGMVLLRASAGRAGDDRAVELDEGELVERVHAELVEAMGLRRPPAAHVVSPWPRAFPQYEPGHQLRVTCIRAVLAADAPHVLLAGAAYGGVGIASCIRQAEEAATQVTRLMAAGSAT